MDIETPRLMLHETYRVVDEHIGWLNDKELMKWSEQQFYEHDFDTQRSFLSDALVNGTPLVWDIRIKDRADVDHIDNTQRSIGTIGSLHAHIDSRHNRADMGIMLGSQYHGNGFAREAWSGVEGYLLHKLNMRKLEAGCVDANVPMLRILMMSGWTPEGKRENHFCYNGKYYDLVLFGKMP